MNYLDGAYIRAKLSGAMDTQTQKQNLASRALPALAFGSFNFCRADFVRCHMGTPMVPPPVGERGNFGPAVCVKAKGINGPVFGRVHTSPNRLDSGPVVIGHGWDDSPEECFVWTGSKDDFNRTWEID